jgi:hypothetical protein
VKVEGYQNQHAERSCLYINNELSEQEIRKTVPFTTASKRTKYLEISLIMVVKDLLKNTKHF